MLDQIFKAYDVRGVYPDQLNEEAARRIGVAAARFLLTHPQVPGGDADTRVVVSRDMRTSSPSLQSSLIDGLRSAGAHVIDVGMCDTSVIYFAVNHLDCAGGIQTTASHNPPQYNGFKISGPLAQPIGATTGLSDIKQIAQSLGEHDLPAKSEQNSCERHDVWDAYREHILRFYRRPSKTRQPLKVVIDASNGMAGKLIPKVFEGLEGLEIVALNFEITGSFVHEPNPLVARNMESTQHAVRKHGAALGACFDGDADRCMLTDEQGRIIGCDHLTALLCGHFLKHTDPTDNNPIPDAIAGSNMVLYDLRSSKVVAETIEELGATPMRCRVGHVFMKHELRESQGVFGGELSGHFYFRDNYYADSGAITLASVIHMLGHTDKSMSALIAPFQKYPTSGEINFRTDDKDAVMRKLKDRFTGKAQIDELDGVTVDAWSRDQCADLPGGWWLNVRASNTEPLLRFNAEAKDAAVLDAVIDRVTQSFGERDHGH